MILTPVETERAGIVLASLIAPLYQLEEPVVIDPVIPSTHGWPSSRRGSYRHTPRGHEVRLTTDLPLNVSTVSIVAHELCHAFQFENHPGNMPWIVCYAQQVRQDGYRESSFERQARESAHQLTSLLLEDVETDQQLAELCGLEWRPT